MNKNLSLIILRCLFGVIGIVVCCVLILSSARFGVSRFLQFSAIIQSRLSPAEYAAQLTPTDPEAHYTKALALVNAQRLPEAVVELREANRLRPHHYYQWMDLGVTLDRLGDEAGALNALKESVRLAPFYAQPRWQLGNLLYRAGRFPEAFTELRLAGRSDAGHNANMIELAWAATDGDVRSIEELLQPQSPNMHLQLALFLAQHARGAAAAAHVNAAGDPQDEIQRDLVRLTIIQLLAQKQFPDAYAAWAAGQPSSSNASHINKVLNGDFQSPITKDEIGFGWQLMSTPRLAASIDPSGADPNNRSLRLEFDGDVAPGAQVVRQIIMVEPNSRYSLKFMSKAENLMSGSPLVVMALDVSNQDAKILGQSASVSPGTSDWREYQTDFSTEGKTSAVVIAAERLVCNQTPCPIFGKLWLSAFSLDRLSAAKP